MPHIAIVGAGGVGGYFGARLVEAGHRVTFIARGEHLETMRRDGLRLLSIAGDALVEVRATSQPAEVGAVDFVIFATKTGQLERAAEMAQPLAGPETIILGVQNGVEAAAILSKAFGASRVVGGSCKILSKIEGPGVIAHTGASPRIVYGSLTGGIDRRLEPLHEALSSCRGVTARLSERVQQEIWSKFLFLASISGVGAVTRAPVGRLRSVPETRALLRAAMIEVQRLAAACGTLLPEHATDRAMGFVDKLPESATTSMQRDLMGGRPSELEGQCGAIDRLGRLHSVATPVHTMLYASLLPMEREARAR